MAQKIPNPRVEELGRKFVDFSESGRVLGFTRNEIDYLSLPDGWGKNEIIDRLLIDSRVCRIVANNPASFEMLEFAYFGEFTNGDEATPIDKWLNKRPAADALRNRIETVSFMASKELWDASMVVADFGSGPGRYAESVRAMSDFVAFRLWRCIDLDAYAIAIGRNSLAQYDSRLKFERANFCAPESFPAEEDKADLGLLIGVLCGMTEEQSVRLLQAIKPHFKSGGKLIAATLKVDAFEQDPESFRIYCNVLGWPLRPKTLDEVKSIFEAAKWEVESITSENGKRPGQYAVVECRLA